MGSTGNPPEGWRLSRPWLRGVRGLARAAACALVLAPFVCPESSSAQEAGLGGLAGSASRRDMPGGPGVEAWIAAMPFEFMAVRAAVARQWGRRSEPETMCDLYWPDPVNCVAEVVQRRNTVTTLELAALLLSPPVAGFRLGAGYGLGLHRFDVSRRGQETGRVEEPMAGAGQPVLGHSWLAVIRHSGLVHERIRLEAGLRHHRVQLQGCVLDAWGLCGDGSFTRLWLGLGYRIR